MPLGCWCVSEAGASPAWERASACWHSSLLPKHFPSLSATKGVWSQWRQEALRSIRQNENIKPNVTSEVLLLGMLGNALVSTAERGLLREGHSLWGKLQWERELLATMPNQIVLLGIHRTQLCWAKTLPVFPSSSSLGSEMFIGIFIVSSWRYFHHKQFGSFPFFTRSWSSKKNWKTVHTTHPAVRYPHRVPARNWGAQLGLNINPSIINNTLWNFNGKLISNGRAAISPDCSRSKLPGNVFVVLAEPNIMEEFNEMLSCRLSTLAPKWAFSPIGQAGPTAQDSSQCSQSAWSVKTGMLLRCLLFGAFW